MKVCNVYNRAGIATSYALKRQHESADATQMWQTFYLELHKYSEGSTIIYILNI